MKSKFILVLSTLFLLNSCVCLKNTEITDANSISVLQLRLLYQSYLEDRIENGFDTALNDEIIKNELYLEQNQIDQKLKKIITFNCDDMKRFCPDACSVSSSSSECSFLTKIRPPGKCQNATCTTIPFKWIEYIIWPNTLRSAEISVLEQNTGKTIQKISLGNKTRFTNTSYKTFTAPLRKIKSNITYNIQVKENINGETLEYTIKNVEFSKSANIL